MSKPWKARFGSPAKAADADVYPFPDAWRKHFKEASSQPGVYRHPAVDDEIERFRERFEISRIGEEPSKDAAVSGLGRARNTVRRVLKDALEELEKLLKDDSGDARQLAWLEHLNRRWRTLHDLFDPRSATVRDLNRQVALRWQDADRATRLPLVLLTCLGVAVVVTVVLAGAYFDGLREAVAQSKEWSSAKEALPEALWQALDAGSVLVVLVLVGLIGLVWLGHRFLVGGWVGSRAKRLEAYVGRLRSFTALDLRTDDEGPPALPSTPRAINRLGIPTWRVVFYWRFLVVLLLILGLAWAIRGIGESQRRYHVLTRLHGCQAVEGYVVWRGLDEMVLLADLRELTDAAQDGPSFGTLVLPRDQFVAMSEGQKLSCKNAAEPVGGGSLALTQALDRQAREMALLRASLDKGLAPVGEALVYLGDGTRDGLSRLARAVDGFQIEGSSSPVSVAGIESRLDSLREAVHETHGGQEEMLAALRDQQKVLETNAGIEALESSRVHELLWITRLQLCLGTRNGIEKLLQTLTQAQRVEYVKTLVEKCENVSKNLPTSAKFALHTDDVQQAYQSVSQPKATIGQRAVSASTQR